MKIVLVAAGVWLALEAALWLMLRGRVEQPLARADHVVVRVDTHSLSYVEKQITDPAAIARIRGYIETRPGRWHKTWHTPPVTHVHAAFYRGDELVGWFASGSNFLQARTVDGSVAMRRTAPEELEELNRLVGAPPRSHLGRGGE
ncbi:MAG TPA: hypothetical protein VFT45_04535 [Longimicrobium sp.]|nr:hypothetical protein [Longimicrobium sp.]